MRASVTALLSVVLGSGFVSSAIAQEARQPPAAGQAPTAVQRVGGKIQEPRKLKNVPPVYPDEAKKARVEGVVILECTISPEGTVVDVKVVRGIPLLDPAAVDAVRQWVYTPTLLEGKAVPVIMTVTVNFRLSGAVLPAPEVPPEPPAPSPAPTGSPEKLADIRRLLDLSGSRATSEMMMDAILQRLRSQARPETPPEFWEMLAQELRAERLDEMVVPIYDKYFTHDEIREYIRFYETSAGRKLGATTPVLAQESMAAASNRGPAVVKRVLDRLRASGYLKQ